MTKDTSRQLLYPGERVSFPIVYRNNSGSLATGVVFSDTLSSDLIDAERTFSGRSISPRRGPNCAWDVPGGLAPGVEGTITITARVSPSIPTPKAITNKVTFQMSGYGPFEDEVLIIVGGLRSHAPAVLNDCTQ
ncbi:MAG TPA: hypothetical protein VJ714_08150 [Anaerolineae bacterium]|nr:hypothetical protein [Anaerolineae bacterium]